jgi:hypothetical protein
MCIVGFTTWSKGWGGRGVSFKNNLFLLCQEIVISYSTLDGYPGTLCCPSLLIKWYGFYPKEKKKVGTLKKCQECVNAPGK